jgi:SAM-dependent methyltransferase
MNKNWEDLVSLNSDIQPNFKLLKPAKEYWENDKKRPEFDGLDYQAALEKDHYPLPDTGDREGYYGPHHFGYWASGFEDMTNLLAAADKHQVEVKNYLDLGCASGRVIRHVALSNSDINTMGCDINRLHVEWCNAHLPANVTTFQNHSIPNLPLADNSLDLASAFSVFTHIEAFESSWLMELQRVLRPGGLAWITVHTEHTLAEMNENWPLWKPVMNHPDVSNLLNKDRSFDGDRCVVRWRTDRSYSSNVFYKQEYLHRVWSKFFEVVEFRRRFPRFQDVLILRKRA